MTAIRVNGDYEIELFYGRAGPAIINHSLEFLAFFLSASPVYTTKSYSNEYLDYVESISGRRPLTVSRGAFTNWWGPLLDLEFERWMNSKLTSAELSILEGWSPGTKIFYCASDIEGINIGGAFLVKDPYGMSGKGIRRVESAKDLEGIRGFPCVLDPLRPRRYDFSHYFFSDGKAIAYENFVDQRFQYRGTLFRNIDLPFIESLAPYSKVLTSEWERFKGSLEKIRLHYASQPMNCGFSVDSFVYEDLDEMKILPICEVNYRRTMGSTAWELARTLGQGGKWALFVLGKLEGADFKTLINRLKALKNVLLLSPPEARFQIFLLSAESEKEGKELFSKLEKLLPDCQFSINIEN